MSLTLNEIRKRAIEFSKEWQDESREKAEAQTFWNEFFNIFGITRRRIASFEEPVRKLSGSGGSIDLFWKGVLVVEHKSRGLSLDKAYSQALDYFPGIEEKELPRYVLVSDFTRFRLYDLDRSIQNEFDLIELHDKINLFDFITGYKKREYKDEAPVNIKAAVLMGKLHDALKADGYAGHSLEVLLIRILFCLFADDTGIFPKDHFRYYLETKTREDGTDLGPQLLLIFDILNTQDEMRQKAMDDDLTVFPYINGRLFEEPLHFPIFNKYTRAALLECCNFDWGDVSPAIFGSMFQSVMDSDKRRDIGGHYTSEQNIIKIINPLFLDDLRNEFESHKNNKRYLEELLVRISRMKFLDPACGCGNFLVISYRELRILEIDIIKEIRRLTNQANRVLDIAASFNIGINVDAMYGIEIEEFPAKIAECALWLVDHQINIKLSEEFGIYYARIPLNKTPNIVNKNALDINWDELIAREELTCILGNPPYAGKKRRNEQQKRDMNRICGHIRQNGNLDYVAAWYVKAADYIQNTQIRVSFVSTNSISEGEQVGILWRYLFSRNIKIHFAHRPFKWFNQASGEAQVRVVIIGFAAYDTKDKILYDYETPNSEPMEKIVRNINPYIVDQDDFLILGRKKPICNVSEAVFGNMPNDGGNFLFSESEKDNFLLKEPDALKFIRDFISAYEFLHNEKRYCLWLVNASPSELKKLPEIKERIAKVKELRSKSRRDSTKKLAEYPYLFGEIRQPNDDYIVIPCHSSENRRYIPMAFSCKDNIIGNSCLAVKNNSLYYLGVLMSAMHMAWVRQICGRLEGRYRYSNNIVYNNFPWPDNPSKENIRKVEEHVKIMLMIRDEFVNESLADLYNPYTMPKRLYDVHRKLDKAVDKCYRLQPFTSELNRIDYLFDLYKKYTQ